MLNVNVEMDTASLNNTLNPTNEEVIEGSHGGPYMVEKIVGVYMGKDYKKYFRVKWLDSWEPAENLSEGCQKLIHDFWTGTDNAGKPVFKDNLQLGEKIIKTEEILSPEVMPAIDVSSSTEQRSNVSSTNDYKVDVSSNNDWSNNITSSSSGKQRKSTSTNQNRNTQATNQNKNIQATNQIRNNQTPNQNRNNQSANQNRDNQTANQNRNNQTANQNRNNQTANQNRNNQTANQKRNSRKNTDNRNTLAINQGTQLANQTKNPITHDKKNTTKRPVQNKNSKNKRTKESNEVEPSPDVHKESVTSSSTMVENSTVTEVTIDQKAFVTADTPSILTSPPKQTNLSPSKTPKLSSPKPPNVTSTNNVMSSPNKKTKSSPRQRVTSEVTSPQQNPPPSSNNNTDGACTSLIPDDGECESKLNVIKNPVKTDILVEENPSTSRPISHPPPSQSIAHPTSSKQEFHSEPMTSNSRDINTVPIKMASPTSVVPPVEVTSTVQDDVDLDDGPNAKKQLKFNNPEFIPKTTTEEPSPVVTSKPIDVQSYVTETDNQQACNNSLPRPPYKDRLIMQTSSPYFSDVQDSDYDQDNESIICNQNNFVGFGNEMESNGEGNSYIDNDEEQNNFMMYSDDVTNNMNRMNNSVRNVRLSNGIETNCSNFDVAESYVNVLGDEEEENGNMTEDDAENYDGGDWGEGNQYNNSQPEDVIALDDSDDDENDQDDLEVIVCIDSPQNRRRDGGRLPTSAQKSLQPDLLFSNTNRGKVPARGRRGRPAQRGRAVGNTGSGVTNEQTTNTSNVCVPPPLLHPRLLLNSPQTQQTEDPVTPRRRRGTTRGTPRGTASRGPTNDQQMCNNNDPLPPTQNTCSTFTTPPRKRPLTQPTMINHNDVHTTPPQNKSRKQSQPPANCSSDIQQNLSNSPSSDYSPSRMILNDRTCTICNHAFPNLTLARQHVKHVHGNQNGLPTTTVPSLVCQVCKAMFKTNKDLKSHMLLHGNLNLHKCDVCFRAFKQRSVLMQHLLIHTDELPYACSVCDKRFRQQGHLILHLGTHGRNNEGSYTCPHCSIDFTDENSFAEHMREHDAELPFKCNFCQQRFELKSNLMLHLEGHNEGRPFTCHICKKSFKKKTYYFGHMQMHKLRGNNQTTTTTTTNENNESDTSGGEGYSMYMKK